MVDAELVTRKLLLVARDLEVLAELGALDRDAYLADDRNEVLAERYIERLIGRLIDVNYHVLTESGQAPPPDYHHSFVRLADLGVLDSSFARRVAGCAGLRKRIVHEYDALDPARVYQAIGPALADVPEYMRAVEAWLSR